MLCIGIILAFGSNWKLRRNPLIKMFLSENMIFWGHVSQSQNGVSTSPLPLFNVDLLAFKDHPRFNSFFQWEF